MPGTTKNAEPNSRPMSPPPECAKLSPILYPVSGIVKAEDLFFCVVILANNGKIFHVEAGLLKLLYGSFCFLMRFVNRYRDILFRHTFTSIFIICPTCLLLLRVTLFTPFEEFKNYL
jgi:hypothetical protein